MKFPKITPKLTKKIAEINKENGFRIKLAINVNETASKKDKEMNINLGPAVLGAQLS